MMMMIIVDLFSLDKLHCVSKMTLMLHTITMMYMKGFW